VPEPTPVIAPAWLPAFNKRVTNRIQGVWAPYLPPYAMVEHVGRRSGRAYRTPVTGVRKAGRLYVPLPYGSRAQWVRNLLAAGEGSVRRAGRRHRWSDLQVHGVRDPAVPPSLRAANRRVGVLSGRLDPLG
jgi:deazaflavin-dependent oxidoreductase (nitroreductase family)